MTSDTQEEVLTFEKTLPIWWALIWRSFLLTAALGVALGLVGGIIGGVIAGILGRGDLGGNLGATLGGILGWLGSFPCSFWALKEALKKDYGGYRIALLKAAP